MKLDPPVSSSNVCNCPVLLRCWCFVDILFFLTISRYGQKLSGTNDNNTSFFVIKTIINSLTIQEDNKYFGKLMYYSITSKIYFKRMKEFLHIYFRIPKHASGTPLRIHLPQGLLWSHFIFAAIHWEHALRAGVGTVSEEMLYICIILNLQVE